MLDMILRDTVDACEGCIISLWRANFSISSHRSWVAALEMLAGKLFLYGISPVMSPNARHHVPLTVRVSTD